MALYNQDFTLESNTDMVVSIDVTLPDGTKILASDIEGATWGFTRFEEDTTPLVSKSLGSGITVPEDGVVNISISKTDTVDLYGEFTHELRLEASGNLIKSASRGRLTIKYQVANNPV